MFRKIFYLKCEYSFCLIDSYSDKNILGKKGIWGLFVLQKIVYIKYKRLVFFLTMSESKKKIEKKWKRKF